LKREPQIQELFAGNLREPRRNKGRRTGEQHERRNAYLDRSVHRETGDESPDHHQRNGHCDRERPEARWYGAQ